MDFKTRFQGRTSTMDKNGVISIVKSTSQPIKKQFNPQNLNVNTQTDPIAQSYFFQKFQKNAEVILKQQTDFDMTPSTRSEYPSYRILQNLQKLNLDQYQIVAIPKKAFNEDKQLLAQSIVQVSNNQHNNPSFQNDQIQLLNIKLNPYNNYTPKIKNLNLNQKNTNLFISAGYGAIRQKKLNFLTDRKTNTQLK